MNLAVLLGSIAAVLALAGIAWLLKLGNQPRIESPEAAARQAREAHSGFRPTEVALDGEGRAALVLGEQGEAVLLRPHGAQIAARVFRTPPRATRKGSTLTIATDERMFGDAALMLGEDEAARWAALLGRP
ncbi:hypothetical protein [Parasphingopyxis lamellibrachiae]|uniref:Uncharacterized protein n=1 Tax=Parasphingopyxis lamellibrachiae TaxID=680125 RepID=A0A3D9FHI6_9SPHN|nr:hypothetical protein [Parasphingopyxis lamellibrachiae]RED17032.1 hypothetical protein DFR46_2066 [Parasphingopyxis lamellibrachiae]